MQAIRSILQLKLISDSERKDGLAYSSQGRASHPIAD